MKIKIILPLLFILLLTACKDYVNEVDPFIDRVTDETLNSEEQIDAARIGIINSAHTYASGVFLNADGLSDALIWDQRLKGATYSSYRQLDETVLTDLSSETNTSFYDVQRVRLLADTLIYRIGKISFTNESKKKEALFTGYFYSGYMRYLLGTYWGKNETTGGATINLSRFLTTKEVYESAIVKLKESLKYTTVANQIKIVNSLIARCYFFLEDYSDAATYLNLGLVKGDNPLVAKFLVLNGNNRYHDQASAQVRIQWRVDDRFKKYVDAEPTEAKRIKYKLYEKTTMLEQTMYIREADGISSTPMSLIDWQEVNLMKAELIVRGKMTGDALALINDIRTSRQVKTLPAGTNITLNTDKTVTIEQERDKELFLRGFRLIDQRRFNSFHNSYGWKFFPIPQAEKIKNPNL